MQDTAQADIKCFECHGTGTRISGGDYRPLDAEFRNVSSGGFTGSHRTHMDSTAKPVTCEKCHPDCKAYKSGHRDGKITLSNKINNSPLAASYGKGVFFNQTSKPVLSTCTSVNCHFESPTPNWGNPPLSPGNCSECHQSPPSDGNHPSTSGRGKKHGEYLGLGRESCSKCHPGHTSFAHATSAGRQLLVQFATSPNSGGSYHGKVGYPDYLPSQTKGRNGTCTDIYCHSDALGRPGFKVPTWGDTTVYKCFYCHRGVTGDSTQANCAEFPGSSWDNVKGVCTPFVNISTSAHAKHVGPQWIRKYNCSYCHFDTVDPSGAIKDKTKHVDGTKQVVVDPYWNIDGRSPAYYNPATKTCQNVYCHSDGTVNPTEVSEPKWTNKGWSRCNACHGHPITGSCNTGGCHDGITRPVFTKWSTGTEWRAAMPIFPNEGPGLTHANSHPRHTGTSFTCGNCHASTIVNGDCKSCHANGLPIGNMGEIAHINPSYHVNKNRDVLFNAGGSYKPGNKTCSNTRCHTGISDPQWGDSVNSSIICLNCHGTNGNDVDTFGGFDDGFNVSARINLTQWVTSGHGRFSSSTNSRYPTSNNPAANFPSNPCWYCHDNSVIHGDRSNPFRLKRHPQYEQRFEKECVYCHMEGKDYECIACHVGQSESLAPQATSNGIVLKLRSGGTRTDWPDHRDITSCTTSASCHDSDDGTFANGGHKGHSTGAGTWDPDKKRDIKNQYVMMGVCLQCHDDDSSGQCTFCHTAPASNPGKYSLGYNPGTGFIKPKQARASAAHFGRKHWKSYQNNGIWKGGKFCWDCHDPHGDSNIYMIQDNVATSTDGTYGVPKTRKPVSFPEKPVGQKLTASDYVRTGDPYNGICNVCHGPDSRHYLNNFSDTHNNNKRCTSCHMHRFADAHADSQSCNACHENAKPVPKHVAFGLPDTCVKCHSGSIGARADVVGQFNSNSHHVQGVTLTGRHCYSCHWESTKYGTIDPAYHEGFNFNNFTTSKNAKVDLVAWQAGARPTFYSSTSAVQFLANRINTTNERTEVVKLNRHCVSCHSDQNNDTIPFNDCKTPRQYAWDGQSIASRYNQLGTTTWGKVNSGTWPNANKKDTVIKALSAHGNAVANRGGWDSANGYDAVPPNTRGGGQNVQCFDCHNSHGSKVNGTTSSYVSFNNKRNGANLKETQKDLGGYGVTYMAQPNLSGKNQYEAGAGQCFDCHENQNSNASKPWGYQSTYGASQAIMGYDDSSRFGNNGKGRLSRFPFRKGGLVGTHFSASSMLNYSSHERINGLCTPCHDPHGVSITLGDKMPYAVPLLKGSWVTSPYQEDVAPLLPTGVYPETPPYRWGGNYGSRPGWTNGAPHNKKLVGWQTDRNAFNGSRIDENSSQFAGLCLRCHQKEKLTNEVPKDSPWKSRDRIHESVKGWGANTEHSFTCSKCHQPHSSGLPRLMVTDCLNYQHRGRVASGGKVSSPDLYIKTVHDFLGGHWGYPTGNTIVDTLKKEDPTYLADPYKYEALTQCHLRRPELTISPAYGVDSNYNIIVPNQWPQENMWNNVTPWPSTTPPRSYSP